MLFDSLPHLFNIEVGVFRCLIHCHICNIEVGVSQCCLIHCLICDILKWVYLNV